MFLFIYKYYIICTLRKYIGIYTRFFRRKALSSSLSQIRPHTHTHTQESDVKVSMSALLDADTLTDDGMHLVLQTGSTAYM